MFGLAMPLLVQLPLISPRQYVDMEKLVVDFLNENGGQEVFKASRRKSQEKIAHELRTHRLGSQYSSCTSLLIHYPIWKKHKCSF